MKLSENYAAIAPLLVKMQAGVKGAIKSAINPHRKFKYMTLADIWDACRESIESNGFVLLQTNEPSRDGITVITTLMHESGEYVQSTIYMPAIAGDPGSYGAAMTYARKFALAALVGVTPDEDVDQSYGEPAKAAPTQARPDVHKMSQVIAACTSVDELSALWRSPDFTAKRNQLFGADLDQLLDVAKGRKLQLSSESA